MPAHVIIIDFFLVFVCLLLKTDGAIGTVAVESAENILDDPFETINDEEHHEQAFHLLMGVGRLMTFHHRGELCAFAHEYPRPQRQSHESLQRDILAIYYFQFHDTPVIIPEVILNVVPSMVTF